MTDAVEPTQVRSIFLVFLHVAAAAGSMQRGGETEIGRGRRLDGEREKVVAFLLFLLLLFRCNCMFSGKSDRLMKTEAFQVHKYRLSLFLLFFCCEEDAVMLGVDFKRCLSLGSGAKPLQVL
jgi:hypothetical protein